MKIGKVPENVLKRSVLGQVKTKREEVILGAGIGEDCAAVKLAPGEVFVTSVDPITGTAEDVGTLGIRITVNDLASAGAEPVGVLLCALLPPGTEEAEIRKIMREVEDACAEIPVQVLGGHTEVTTAVTRPVVTVTGVGKAREEFLVSTAGARPGQDVIVSKWIGIEGTSIIAKEKECELRARFSQEFIDAAKAFDRHILVLDDSRAARKAGVSAMHDVTEGGIFGALWELAEASGVGLSVDLKKIPVRQETIELCEMFGLNPYMLISSGCMLMAADNGYDVVRALEADGIKGTVIGKVTEGGGRLVTNGGETRFLERPKTDELYKIYE